MSYQEELAAQMERVNRELNEAWETAKEHEELQAVLRSIQDQMAALKGELENGTLQGLFGHFALLYQYFQTAFRLAKETDSGQQLAETLTGIQRFYMELANTPANTHNAEEATSLDEEFRNEEIELEQARRLKQQLNKDKEQS